VASVQHSVLEALEGARNYNGWLASLARPYLGDDPLEIGSGRGTYLALWLEPGIERFTATEIDAELVAHLRDRFSDDDRVTVAELDLLDAPRANHSAVVALNVLEHIADDVAGLRGASRLVRPGGAVILVVPAFSLAMSRFDRDIGHYRRYTAKTLRQAFSDAGLAVEDLRYVNAPGLLAWTVGMRLLRMAPREGSVLRVWDSVVVPPTRALERRWRPPFGQSLFAVGRTAA
jgi:SAM-dependent methyltransferase